MSYDQGVLWQQSLQNLPSLYFSQAAADENGDFVVPGVGYGPTFTKFYGANGLPEWTHDFGSSVTFEAISAVDSQGDVYAEVINGDYTAARLVELASSTGQAVLSANIPDNEASYAGSGCDGPSDSFTGADPGQVSILSDGSVQLQFTNTIFRVFEVDLRCNTASQNTLNLLTVSGTSVTSTVYIVGRPLHRQGLPLLMS